jgi:hypothetical protein
MGVTQSSDHVSNDENSRRSVSSIFFRPLNGKTAAGGGGGGGWVTTGNGTLPPPRPSLKERKRHGFVTVKLNSVNSNRRVSESATPQIITPRGAILFGSLFNPAVIQNGMRPVDFALFHTLW